MRVNTSKAKNMGKGSLCGKIVLIFKVLFRKETSTAKEYIKAHLLNIPTKESTLRV